MHALVGGDACVLFVVTHVEHLHLAVEGGGRRGVHSELSKGEMRGHLIEYLVDQSVDLSARNYLRIDEVLVHLKEVVGDGLTVHVLVNEVLYVDLIHVVCEWLVWEMVLES